MQTLSHAEVFRAKLSFCDSHSFQDFTPFRIFCDWQMFFSCYRKLPQKWITKLSIRPLKIHLVVGVVTFFITGFHVQFFWRAVSWLWIDMIQCLYLSLLTQTWTPSNRLCLSLVELEPKLFLPLSEKLTSNENFPVDNPVFNCNSSLVFNILPCSLDAVDTFWLSNWGGFCWFTPLQLPPLLLSLPCMTKARLDVTLDFSSVSQFAACDGQVYTVKHSNTQPGT